MTRIRLIANMSRQGKFARVSIKFGYRKTLRQNVPWSRHGTGAPTRSLKRRTYLSFAESVVAFASLCQAGGPFVSRHRDTSRNIELTYSNMLDRRTLLHIFLLQNSVIDVKHLICNTNFRGNCKTLTN